MANSHQSPRFSAVIGTYIFRDIRYQRSDSNLEEKNNEFVKVLLQI